MEAKIADFFGPAPRVKTVWRKTVARVVEVVHSMAYGMVCIVNIQIDRCTAAYERHTMTMDRQLTPPHKLQLGAPLSP